MASSSGTARQPENELTSAFHGIAPPLASTSASSSLPYDVFINHRGIDVKRTLATTIYHTLSNIGYQVFLDEEKLQLGDYLPVAIEEAMHKALLHIAIFSKNYAQSPWCLAELAFMLETGTKIVPIFYYVQPDDLRWAVKGKGKYAHSFFQHELKGRYTSQQLQRWKEALHKASFYSGHIINNDEDERRLLKIIVNSVLDSVRNVPFEVAKHPVGLDEAVEDFEKTTFQSAQGHQSVQIVGIWGMGGSGKTTLAKKLYNRRHTSMVRCSFLFDVRDAASKGLLHNKQMKLLDDLGVKGEAFDNIEQGKGILARRLRSAKVFIVLDDVDDVDQVAALLPLKESLGLGSLIIVTTREKEVFRCCGISSVYKMKTLDTFHAKQLFCWHAFLSPSPPDGFEDLVGNCVDACKGLPLSLKVFGGQLYGISCKDYWQSQLDKISRILPEKVKDRLKISYDALDLEEKEAFLDTACFFIGEERSLAIEIWKGSGWSGLCCWESLLNKCLVELDEMNCIRMHDHLRDLGREISNQQSPYRLWLPQQQTINIGKQVKKRIATRGIIASSIRLQWKLHEGGQRFREISYRTVGEYEEFDGCSSHGELMVNTSEGIRTLAPSLVGVKIIVTTGPNLTQLIGEELVCLRWFQIEQTNLPSKLSLKNLRVLELYEEEDTRHHLKELWKDAEDAPLQLRELVISGTTKFRRLPESIGSLNHLKKIVLVNNWDECNKLKSLPRGFCLLQSLEHLELRSCRLSSLPDNFGDLRNLRYLHLSWRTPPHVWDCGELRRLPASFKLLTLLQHLHLEGFHKLTLESDIMKDMTKLEYLNLDHCKKLKELPRHITNQTCLIELHFCYISMLREVPVNIGQLSKLRKLHLGSKLLTSLPTSLGNLSSLTSLKFNSCARLVSLPTSLGDLSSLTSLQFCECGKLKSLPYSLGDLSSLTSLVFSFCNKLKSLPDSLGDLSSLTSLEFSYCHKLKSLPDSLGDLSSLTSLQLAGCYQLKSLPDSLGDLSSLITLYISRCEKLKCLPDSVGRLNLLEHLSVLITKVKSLPESIRQLINLQTLVIDSCPISELDLGEMSFNLKRIELRSTDVSKISISEDCCPGLDTLVLKHNYHLIEI